MKPLVRFLIVVFLLNTVVISKAQIGGGTQNQIDNIKDKATNTFSTTVLPAAITVQKYADRAKKAYDEVIENNAFQTILNGSSATLPFAIKKDGVPYMIIIDSIVLEKKDAYVTAYCIYENPKNPAEKYVFVGNNIRFTKRGGFTGTGRLELVEAPPVKIGPSSDPYLTIQFMSQYVASGENQWNVGSSRSTFVEFDCNGFKQLNIDADITFSKKHVWAENPNGEVMKDTSLTVSFKTNITSGSGWLIDLNNVPKFQFRKLPGYTFQIDQAAFDNHTAQNPSKLSFPANYGADDLGNAWTGFYGSSIKMWLPKGFKRKKSESNASAPKPDSVRIYISVNRVIFDDFGFTIDVEGENLISMSQSDHKWKLSLDYFHLVVVKNQFKNLQFQGKMELPIQDNSGDESKSFLYDGIASFNENTKNLDYSLSVTLAETIEAECFKVAHLTLKPGSSVTATYKNDRFDLATDLYGTLAIKGKNSGDNSNKEVGFQIEFDGLRLATYHEHFNVKRLYASAGVSAKLGPLTISLTGVGLSTRSNFDDMGADTTQRGIRVSMGTELSGENNGSSFGGGATFTIWAKRMKDSEKWRFVEIEFNKLSINVKNDFYSLYGEIEQGNIECWGSYYSGSIVMTLMEGKIRVAADARFGQKDDKKYWGVNGFVGGFTIPLGPAFGLNMFSGGLTKGMKISTSSSTEDDPCVWACKSTGMRYEFAANGGLSVMAGVGLQNLPTANIFAGSVYFSVAFTTEGGLQAIGFRGGVGFFDAPAADNLSDSTTFFERVNANVNAVTPPPKPVIMGMSDPKLTLGWDMTMDFENSTFRGDFDIWAKVGDLLKGSYNSDGYAGRMSILFSPDDWYIWIGRPIAPISMSADVKIAVATVSGYFLVGSVLPDPPIALNPFGKRFKTPTILYDALTLGGGVAFGTKMEIDAFLGLGSRSKKTCSVKIGVDLWAIAGFDLLMQKSNDPVTCAGESGPRGIKNWYAMGQLYFGAGAKFVVGAKCFGVGGDFNVAGVELYLYLVGQFPNPNYFYGMGQGGFDVLGVVHLDFDFEVEIGKRCVVTSGNINERAIKVIAQMSPGRGTEDASVYTKPQVFFEFPLEKEVKMNLENPGGQHSSGTPLKVRPVFDYVVLKSKSGGQTLTASFYPNANGLSGTVVPGTVLAPNTEYEVFAQVSFEKYSNGSWVTTNDFKSDTMTTWFKTGNSDPSKIDLSNVKFAYPSPGMTNFYKDEYPTGYLTTVSLPGQAFTVDKSKHAMEVSIKGSGVDYKTTNVIVDQNAHRQISYPLPSNLKPSSSYTLTITKKSINTTYKDEEVISYTFTTSQYATFSAKVGSISVQKATPADWNVTLPIPRTKDEGFSSLELSGSSAGDVELQRALISFQGGVWPRDFEEKYTSVFPMFNVESMGVNYFTSSTQLKYNNIAIGSSNVQIYTWKAFYEDVNKAIIDMNFDYLRIVTEADPKGPVPGNAAALDARKNELTKSDGVLSKIKPEKATGKTFSLVLLYTLPGETASNTTAYMTYKIEK